MARNAQPRVLMGRKKKLEEWSKTTVVLQETERIALDEMAMAVRKKYFLTIARSELIREALHLVLESERLKAEAVKRVIANRPRKSKQSANS